MLATAGFLAVKAMARTASAGRPVTGAAPATAPRADAPPAGERAARERHRPAPRRSRPSWATAVLRRSTRRTRAGGAESW